jgi:hypothetical protein
MTRTSTTGWGSLALGLCAVACAVAWPGAAAAGPVAGFKVSTPVVDGLDVQVDLTAYTAGTVTPPSFVAAGAPIDSTFSTSYVTSYDFGYGYAPTVYLVQKYVHSDWNTTAPAALDFGDFQTQQTAILGLVALAGEERGAGAEGGLLRGSVGVQGTLTEYKGSFVHSYSSAGTYNVKAKLTPDGEVGTPGLGPATIGNPYFPTPLTGSWISGSLALHRVYSLHVERTMAGTAATVQDLATTANPVYPNTLRYISNSVDSLGVDALPVIDIKTPRQGANFGGNTVINFVGDAVDAEDGNLTAGLTWSSDLDGPIGVGGSFFHQLSPGLHTVSATVMDSFGNVAMKSIQLAISIGGPNFSVLSGLCPGIITLEVAGVSPGDKVAFFTSDNPGTTIIGDACAGAVIDLDAAQLRSRRFGDAVGTVVLTRFFPLSQCNLLMQVINLGVGGSACSVSNVLSPPGAALVEGKPGLAPRATR